MLVICRNIFAFDCIYRETILFNKSRGDVILEINKLPVTNEDDFHHIESQMKSGQDVVFLVRPRGVRDNSTVFMGGTLP